MIESRQVQPAITSMIVLAIVGLIGCTAPMARGRTGETLAQRGLRVGTSIPFGMAFTRARVRRTRTSGEQVVQHIHDTIPPGSYTRAFTRWANRWFSPLLSVELGGAYGLADGLELGGVIGMTRVGVELRTGVLGRHPAQLVALALSAGVAKQVFLAPRGIEWRGGVDLSLRLGALRPLVNVYLGYVPSRQVVTLPDLAGESTLDRQGDDLPDAVIDQVRDELRLSVPIGVAIGGHDDGDAAHVVTLVLIPEVVLATYNEVDEPPSDNGLQVESFHQRWSLYFELRTEFSE